MLLTSNCLTVKEKRECLQSALASMPIEQQMHVNQSTADIVASVKSVNPHTQISEEGALELLAAVGMFLNK